VSGAVPDTVYLGGTMARALVGRLLAVAAVLAGTVAVAPVASAQPVLKTAVFDPPTTGWVAVHDLTEVQFDEAFATWAGRGYLVMDLDVDATAGGLRLGATWQYNSDHRGWLVKPRLTEAELDQWKTTARRSNLRLHDLEPYLLGGTRYYGAVWVQNVEGLGGDDQHNLTYDEAVSYYQAQRSTRLPVDVDAYPTSAGVRYALIWLDNPGHLGWRLHLSLSDAEFAAAFDSYDDTMRMLVIDAVAAGSTVTAGGTVTVGGEQRYAGIWLVNPGGRQFRSRRDLTATEYGNWWHRYADEGFREIGYERYETSSGTRYATVWRQNSDRPLWALKGYVDTRVQKELDDWQVPGISVAVIQAGQVRYLRGFGLADVDAGVWLDSGHVLRTASVSKAVAGVLTMRLYEMGELTSVYDPTGSYLPGLLPAQHAHTIEQLVSNRGCVRHYESSLADPDPALVDKDNELQTIHFGSALEPAEQIWDDHLVAGCVIGQDNNYSTHGYTILGAALESAAGTLLPDLVRQVLVDPYQLGTLRPEDLTDPAVRRSRTYNKDNTPATPDENTWSILGAGMESSVADLAGFGAKLLAGQIISPLAREYMWSGTGWSYAYGWQIDTQTDADGDVHRRVWKTGGQLGCDAYLQLFPDDDIVIAVLSNRRGATSDDPNSHDTADVGVDIGQQMIDALP
jgi:CubicO group peptidase (beta-lactamase class C family)